MWTLDQETAERCLRVAAGCLLVLHIPLIIQFAILRLWLMAGVNLLCVLADAVCFVLLAREAFRGFTLTFYGSELVHLLFSIVFVGWSAGFQIPLLGLAAFAFFGEYLGRSLRIGYVPALPLSIAPLAACLLAFRVHFHEAGRYNVPTPLVGTVQFIWGLLVLGMMLAGMFMVMQTIFDSERLLTNKAQTDKLTGLYNRAGYDYLRTRTNLETTMLLLIDGDKFKSVNDTYGHETGDLVLQKIARELHRCFRQQDYVCRIGGDEFAVMLRDAGMLDEGMLIGKVSRINQALSHTMEDRLPSVSISVGAACGGDAADWTELFNHADSALYRVKQEGGRGCRFYKDT